MTETTAILFIIVGSGMIYFGFTIKQFYAARGLYGAALSDRKIARWKGRLLFVVIGALFVFFGFKYFFYGVFH